MAVLGPNAGLYGVAGETDEAQQSFGMSLIDSIPSAWSTSAWNLGRTSNAMIRPPMHRAFGMGRQVQGVGGFRQGISQTLGPRHLTRLGRAVNIDPSAYGAKSGIYSPFNTLARIGNYPFKEGTLLRRHMPAAAAERLSGAAGGTLPFSPGTFGRAMGMSKINKMSDAKFARREAALRFNIADINRGYATQSFTPGINRLSMTATSFGDETGTAFKYATSSGFGSTITGSVSGRMVGWNQGVMAAYQGEAALAGARSTATGAFGKGVGEGAEWFAKNEGTRLAGFIGKGGVGAALKGVNIAGNIMLVHDLAMLGGKLVGKTLKTGLEAMQSVKGSIDKPIMGMGFKDNSVAATSRQRGVMAISASRLNARSLLGSEASMMAAHFG